MKISVIGCGYLGATHAAAMAELGYDVRGVESDPAKLAVLASGEAPFHEPGLAALIQRGLESGRLGFTSDPADVADWADVHFLCVGTPQRPGELAADLGQVDAAVDALGAALTRPTVVVGKSTVPVGTAAELQRRLSAVSPAGAGVRLLWSPEFLREGHAVQDTLRPDRLVFGAAPGDDDALALLRAVYAEAIAAGTPVIECDLATAELVKAAANSFLATKISFINAMAEVCEAAGADVTVLADALGYDPRIGRRFLDAGLGFGGGCLPKDIRAFMARAGELGVGDTLAFLREVDALNEHRREKTAQLATELLGQVSGARVAVLGAAFKPDSDDIRDSPALDVAGRLHLMGAHVVVHDPAAMDNARTLWPTLEYADSVADACADADLVLVLTEWQQFRSLDPVQLGGTVRTRRVVDGRNCLDAARWRAAGWDYHGLGRAGVSAQASRP